MKRTSPGPVVAIDGLDVAGVKVAAAMIEDADWQSCELTASLRVAARDAARVLGARTRLCRALEHRLLSPSLGYAILDASAVGGLDSDEWYRRLLVVIGSAFGRVFGAFVERGLWRHVGVNDHIAPSRSEGTGFMPLHHDFVNTQLPPDIVVLRCRRADPAGGGASLVANIPQALAQLSSHELATLCEGRVGDGAYFNLHGMAGELNPFPVLAARGHAFSLRFADRVIQTLPASPLRSVMTRLGELMFGNHARHLLSPGQTLFLNQHFVCHGRAPLGTPLAPPTIARSLEQTFIRLEPTPWRQPT